MYTNVSAHTLAYAVTHTDRHTCTTHYTHYTHTHTHTLHTNIHAHNEHIQTIHTFNGLCKT